MQRLCDWVKGRSISVIYIYIYIVHTRELHFLVITLWGRAHIRLYYIASGVGVVLKFVIMRYKGWVSLNVIYNNIFLVSNLFYSSHYTLFYYRLRTIVHYIYYVLTSRCIILLI